MSDCNPGTHHRRSIRLKNYDYSQSGAYFVTICTKDRECLFGDIIGDRMVLNAAGEMLKIWLMETRNKFPQGEIDEFVVMPNHFHVIINIVQWFKTMTTNASISGVKLHGWQPFNGKLWQRNYYEHIHDFRMFFEN